MEEVEHRVKQKIDCFSYWGRQGFEVKESAIVMMGKP
jgi:hypothetical protein